MNLEIFDRLVTVFGDDRITKLMVRGQVEVDVLARIAQKPPEHYDPPTTYGRWPLLRSPIIPPGQLWIVHDSGVTKIVNLGGIMSANPPVVVEKWTTKLEHLLVKIGSAAGFVASLVATAKNDLPTDVGTASTIVSGVIFEIEHHWTEVKAIIHAWIAKL